MKRILVSFWIIGSLLTCAPSGWAAEKITIIATLPDLADIASRIAGDAASVESLARGVEDPHGVPLKPSFVVKLNRADLLLLMGLEYEHSWLPALIDEARNPKIRKGSTGYIDCSVKIAPKEVPGTLSRSEGDLHPAGNPHYNLDPEGGRAIAIAIFDGLARNYPALKPQFEANLRAFLAQLDTKTREWEALGRPLKGLKLVSYHRDIIYFADRYGMEIVGDIELKPGIEPTAGHLIELVGRMKAQGVKVVIREPHFSEKVPNQVAAQVGAQVVKLPIMVGGVPEAKTYFDLIEYNLRAMLNAAQAAGVAGKG
jgi:zinc/manganese transport system substrate-binding protein